MASHTTAGLTGVAIPLVTTRTWSTLSYKKIGEAIFAADAWHGGKGVISGTVKESGSPAAPVVRRVRLYRKVDGLLVRETWSDAAGNYSFPNIAVQLYYVLSFDHLGNYNAVVKDSITPEV